MRVHPRRVLLFPALAVSLTLLVPVLARAQVEDEEEGPPSSVTAAGTVSAAETVAPEAAATVRFDELAAKEARGQAAPGPERIWMPLERQHPAEPYFPPAPEGPSAPKILAPAVASPAPASSFMGLDDVPMADSMYIVIPPDVGGAVGPTRVMEAFNNNYRIRDKATGTTLYTLGTATFWAPVVAAGERLSLTDPRTVYDPYNDCWIVAMQTYTSGAGKLLVGVSQTNDPAGSWYLYSYNTGHTIDFPVLGFSKNWISLSVNRYGLIGTFQRGINLVVDYPMARTGTGTGTLFTHASQTHFCSAPCVTYSATEDTLYVLTHLSSSGATYQMDWITGTSASPTYTSGGTLVRTGGGWAQPGGNILPQSAPNFGSSACGTSHCPLECQDSQVRSAPAYRDGSIYYAQTIGLPSGGYTHTAVQWTQIAAPGGAFVDGGRLEDPTATTTSGLWYAYPHIAVNATGDFILGFSRFSYTLHPSAGYAIHVAGDGAGTLRDPYIYHAGEDYYHKTFSTATGRNRWGDFSTAQVDPADDMTLWTLQEYAKARVGTDDGNTGSNSSRWSSWWAGVATQVTYTITASAGAGGTITPDGAVVVAEGADTTFTIAPDSCHVIADVLVDAVSQGALTTYPFPNVIADHTIEAVFTPLPDDTITATAGPGGVISPSGEVLVACGDDQMFSIIPDAGYSITDVVVDSASVGTPSTYTFPGVTGNHTIDAQFADTDPPSCSVTSPNGGDSLRVGSTQTLAWTASDNDSVTCLDLLLSRTGAGGPYDTLAVCLPDTGSYDWTVTGPTTDHALFRILVHDASGNVCDDESDGEFAVFTPTTGVTELPGRTVTAFTMTLGANPVRGHARMELAVPRAGRVRVAVFDVSGREVAVLEDRDFDPGRYEITWDAKGQGGRVPAGLYFIRATGLGRTLVDRLVITE